MNADVAARMRAPLLAGIALACSGVGACTSDDATVAPLDASTAIDASSSGLLDSGSPDGTTEAAANPDCPDPGGDVPATLECTGLYSDFASKTIAPGLVPYAPAVSLWVDGLAKQRWIALPAGTTIDDSDPNEWKFPVGTRIWKEMSLDGKRVETRYFEKRGATLWVHGAYVWNADDGATTKTLGGDLSNVLLDGGVPYHVPTTTECDECHRGKSDRLLGFEAVGLGLPGASGLTLAQLASQGLLAPAPARTALAIDDPDGAIAWLHANCGLACHSPNSNATAYGTGLHMRLDPTLLDGAHPQTAYDVYATGVGQNARTLPGVRIAPGDPDGSLLVHLISARNPDYSGQMPPIVTKLVDGADVAKVRAWIAALPHAIADAGADADADAGADAGADADPGADAAHD